MILVQWPFGVPRNEWKNGRKKSVTVSVICIQGHKEMIRVQYAATYLATAWDCVLSVNSGLHVGEATVEGCLESWNYAIPIVGIP